MRVFAAAVAVMFVGMLGARAVYAQVPGSIHLAVEDESGMAMQAAGKFDGAAFQTDAAGQYDFTGVTAGRHRIEVSRAGFATKTITLEIEPGRAVSRVMRLDLASQTSKVDVVETMPLAGVNLTPDQVAVPIQTVTDEDLAKSGAVALPDLLNRRLNGVYLNEMQGNPFQPDVNFRGYTASPLLGTPQGISVYLDGVRQNQPFGDVVAWDLIPKNAIAEVSLVPGSDPLFGLNTLGGAVSVQTKNGATDPGLAGSLLYGSSGRKQVEAQWGGSNARGFNWFLAGTGFHESGWRYDSPSDVRQGFGRVGWIGGRTELSLTAMYAYNTLLGNGIQDYRLLAANYASAYTVADSIAERSPAFNLLARHMFSDRLTFAGNAWYRNIRNENINPNFNTDVLGNDIYQPDARQQAVLSAAGYAGFPAGGATAANTPFPKYPCIAEALSRGNPDAFCDGVLIYSKGVQNDYGVSGQLTWTQVTRIGKNQFTAGAAGERGSVDFTQNTAYAYVDPNLALTPVPAWQDGSPSNGTPGIDSRVNLHGATPNWSVYFADTLTLMKSVNVTVSGRYNRFTVNNTDRINPPAGPGSLTGDYVFERFNPAIGVTWSPTATLNLYASYRQGSRAPTSIELGCADPDNPCSLPNALASDPPLKKVVTDTWEAGVRGRQELPLVRNLRWNVGAFRAENHNDILFVAAPQTGTGYFQNFGKTRREGFDASVGGRVGNVSFGLDYTFLLATFQSTDTLDGSSNNTNDAALAGFPGLDGVITVHPGNRIPAIPKHTGKAWLDWQVTPKLGIDVNEIVVGSSYARGNENNAYQADGVYYLGPGVSPGYAVTNLRAHYEITKRIDLGVEIDNLFNRRYYTAAQLATSAFTERGTVLTTPFAAYDDGPFAGSAPVQSVTFFAPGAPRRAWVELRVKW